ncbi:hypothetical protein [Sphingosinicella sp. LY1275]|uniref:hypothetical protein n=1 Tax=Sphingosinicella sp. LY1275 TaxID=3095379 RepID=UPI002ADED41D|nr:hypothetical protein [Sphingosinicella sp. LY1275]MEA1013698.1 hypothetical protein [Sphingosinicella sp. LY1275]
MSLTKEQRWKVGGGAAVVVAVLLPLWGELHEPGQTLWNVFLFLMLIGLLVGTILLQRHLMKNIDQIGEARFDTRNKK